MARMVSSQGLVSLLLLLLPSVYGGNDVYVDPIASSCSDFNCTRDASALLVQNRTLDEALASISSQSTLHLRPGCHCIQSFNFVQNINEVALVGEGPRSVVNITCAEGLGLAFYNISTFSLRNITVDGCGLTGSNLSTFRHTLETTIDLFFHIHPNDIIAVSVGGCVDLRVENVTVTNTVGLGFLGINLMGTSSVLNSIFSNNCPTPPILPPANINISAVDPVGGGALFLYHDFLNHTSFCDSIANLSIDNSTYSANHYSGFASVVGLYYQLSETIHNVGYILGGGGGLTVTMAQLNYFVNANVRDCLFEKNTARYGGGAHVEIFAGVSHSAVTFSDCRFERNGHQDISHEENILDIATGGGLVYFKDFVQPNLSAAGDGPFRRGPFNLILQRTTFQHNVAFTGGAVTVNSRYSPLLKLDSEIVHFNSCVFENNSAFIGAAVHLKEEKSSGIQPGIYFVFENTSLTGNKVYVSNSAQLHSLDLAQTSSVIDADAINMTLKNSHFTGNSGTALRTQHSIVHLEGNVTFENNTGAFGGALRLSSTSFLVVRNNSNTTFRNNIAELSGGAIYLDGLSSLLTVTYFDCFMFFDGLNLACLGNVSCVDITKTGARLNFIGNRALRGSVIYGSTLETCSWGVAIRYSGKYSNLSLFEILYMDYHDVFNFDTAPNTTKQVSTDTHKVEVLNGRSFPVNVTPGEEFQVEVSTLDRFSRKIPSVLASKVGYDGVNSTLGLSGYWFTGGSPWTPITLYGEENISNITVTLITTDTYAQADITVNLLNCTPTFIFNKTIKSCVCDSRIEREGLVSCNSSSKNLTVADGVWVGTGQHGKETLETQCIKDYCEHGSRDVHPPDFDVQCRSGYNRTGIACGECKEGYSTVFGTNKCMKCDNSYLFWILLHGMMGLAIIFIICYLRITISEGYLLSVLFFANVVHVYTPSFIEKSSTQLQIVFIPIAWLNLDLGIPSCFYDGMDAVARTGLHLVFPAYLFLLMFLIIILARRSRRFCELFSRGGFSASKLFATLMLMTHTSLAKTCSEILGFATLKQASGELVYMWPSDPNVTYFDPARVPLVIIAIVLLLFYIIPAPLLLIFPNLCRNLKVFQRLMPIYDAFWAPFKPRQRYWVGLRLLLRGFPVSFVFFLFAEFGVTLLGLFLLIITYIQLLAWPFKTTLLNVLDLFFQFSIMFLVILTLFFDIVIRDTPQHGLDRVSVYQFATFTTIVLTAYAIMLTECVVHLLYRFPILKVVIQQLWQKVCCWVDFKSKPGSISVSFSRRSSSSQKYGATTHDPDNGNMNTCGDELEDSNANLNDIEGAGNVVRKVVFSELREPLLESGELSVVGIPQEICKIIN